MGRSALALVTLPATVVAAGEHTTRRAGHRVGFLG